MMTKPTHSAATRCLPALVAAAVAALLSSCFTGVESTPRITASDVRDAGVAPSAEQAFAASIRAEAPATWQPGKRWMVVDDRISIIFNSSSTARRDSLRGHEIRLRSVTTVPSVTGVDALDLTFDAPDGGVLVYRPEGAAEEILERAELPVPFAVEMSAVEAADSMMSGKRYFISTPLWYDGDFRAIDGLRHVEVSIDSVRPGTAVYPLKVAFTPIDYPERAGACAYLTYGASTISTRNFDRIFSYTDPRRTYPRIEPTTWERIIHSKVAEGMTRDECRLALGTPAKVDRGATQSSQIERWTYNNGVYLIFEDGILIRFRQ